MAAKRKAAPARKTARKPARRITAARTARTAPPPSRSRVKPISPCLWYDSEAEDAARYYVSIFKDAKMGPITRYPAVGQEIHGRAAGSVMTAEFTLNGVEFLALNGGPIFKFSEAISMQVFCRDQKEIDYYWEKLGEGGDPRARQCGWLKDKYGLSWQIVPDGMAEMMNSPNRKGAERAFAAMMEMKKLDIAALQKAFKG